MVTLEEITVIGAPIERCFDLARSVEVHLAGNVCISGSPVVAWLGFRSGLVALGERSDLAREAFCRWHELTSQIAVIGAACPLSRRHDSGHLSLYAARSLLSLALGKNDPVALG